MTKTERLWDRVKRNPEIVVGAVAAAIIVAMVIILVMTKSIDLAALQPWQPLLAALIALGAASLAYSGAMAKLHFDREVQEKEAKQRRNGIFLRLFYALGPLFYEFRNPFFGPGYIQVDREKELLYIKDRLIVIPPEIEESWSNLDIFSEYVALRLGVIRENFRELATLARRADREEHGQDSVQELDIGKIRKLLYDISDAARGTRFKLSMELTEVGVKVHFPDHVLLSMEEIGRE